MANIENKFENGSVIMNAGSSLNGDIHITGDIYQDGSGKCKRPENQQEETTNIGSPLQLSKEKGTKIDFIRIMNAWYECGKVENIKGGRPTKKEFFTWIGKLFNIDLSNYDKDLSNSMASSTAFDKQLRIFEELKKKHEDIYNSK